MTCVREEPSAHFHRGVELVGSLLLPTHIHSSRLEVNEDSTGNIAVVARLRVVDADALELEVSRSLVLARRVDTVLLRDDLPL